MQVSASGARLARIMPAAMLGNVLEWYDYALYGLLAGIIGNTFFPGTDDTAKLLATFGVFAIGFFARPFGGIFFGYIGDRFGRRRALSLAILMMAIPTGLTGILPTYDQIGIFASVLLTLIRLVQGFSLGGEHSGTVIYLTEHAPNGKKGVFGSSGVACAALGILCGSLTVHFLTAKMGTEEFTAWGWRLTFLVGVLIGIAGLYLRLYCEESPDFVREQEEERLHRMPLSPLFRDYWGHLLRVVFIIMMASINFFIVGFYFGTMNSKLLGYSDQQSLLVATVNLSLFAVFMPIGGALSDRYGRSKFAVFAAVLILLFCYPLFKMALSNEVLVSACGQALFTMLSGLYVGVAVTLGVESFPINIRYTGNGIAHNISTALFGGTTPMIFLWLNKYTESPELGMALYVSIAALLGVAAIKSAKAGYSSIT